MKLLRGLVPAFALAAFLGVSAGCGGGGEPAPSEPAKPAAGPEGKLPDQPQPQEPARTPVEYSARREVEVAYDRARFGEKKVEIWYTTDDGQHWINGGEVDRTKEKAGFTAPANGKFGFRFVSVSAEGRREYVPKPCEAPESYTVIDTTVPEAAATGLDRLNSPPPQIGYEIKNRGFLPIKVVTLYARAENSA